MRKLIAGLMLALVCVGQVRAEEVPVSEKVAGVGAIGAGAVLASVATGGLAAGLMEYMTAGVFAGGIVVGVWREIVTDPAKVGKFRYAGQDAATGEDRKWTRMTGTRWKGLAAYEKAEGSPVALNEAEIYSAWLHQFDVQVASRI